MFIAKFSFSYSSLSSLSNSSLTLSISSYFFLSFSSKAMAIYFFNFRSCCISASPSAIYLRLLKGKGYLIKRVVLRRGEGESGDEQSLSVGTEILNENPLCRGDFFPPLFLNESIRLNPGSTGSESSEELLVGPFGSDKIDQLLSYVWFEDFLSRDSGTSSDSAYSEP